LLIARADTGGTVGERCRTVGQRGCTRAAAVVAAAVGDRPGILVGGSSGKVAGDSRVAGAVHMVADRPSCSSAGDHQL